MKMFSRANRGQIALIALYVVYLLSALAFHFDPPEKLVGQAYVVLFGLGPLFVFLDMICSMQKTRSHHHLETALRLGAVACIYSTVLPGLAAPNVSPGMIGPLLNFTAMYGAVALGLHKFVIRPNHWLRYDNRFHTGFLVVMVAAIILELGIVAPAKGAGLWLLAALTMGLHVAWRHALWYNASQKVSPGQHADVWPALARNNEPPQFWLHLYKYTLQLPAGMPAAALEVLSLPTLLGYFTYGVVDLSENKNHDFEENVKLAINEKEPRATFIWQLYPAAEAAGYIAKIEEFVANAQTETMELPEL